MLSEVPLLTFDFTQLVRQDANSSTCGPDRRVCGTRKYVKRASRGKIGEDGERREISTRDLVKS